jgi:predicted O-methyltransferase YrrM
MSRSATKLIKKLPWLRQFFLERDQLRAQVKKLGFPPGHFHSPIPCVEEIKRKEAQIFDCAPRAIPAVDLNEEQQLALFQRLKRYYKEQPFEANKKEGIRYFFENDFYPYADAIILYCMLRETKPRQVVEVGSGYSSCVMLDTNQLFFNNAISCTFIEPFPNRLLSLLSEEDKRRNRIIQGNLQELDPGLTADLAEGDILFIDSSHVVKTASDVNHIFFEILPRLKNGVYVHFHDVMYPFEYPKEFVYKGWAWNEAYMLRAFLQYNSAFQIQFFYHFFERFHRDELLEHMPLCLKSGGASIWIKKCREGRVVDEAMKYDAKM